MGPSEGRGRVLRCVRFLLAWPASPGAMGGTRTDASASAVHGRDPQLLFEKILRARIYDTRYWKERCFGLNEETLLDEAVAAAEKAVES